MRPQWSRGSWPETVDEGATDSGPLTSVYESVRNGLMPQLTAGKHACSGCRHACLRGCRLHKRILRIQERDRIHCFAERVGDRRIQVMPGTLLQVHLKSGYRK